MIRLRPAPQAGARLDLSETKLRRVLATMLDESEFFSPYGIRALSRYHAEHPYVVSSWETRNIGVGYFRRSLTAACSGATPTGAGRSMAVNGLIIRALLQYYAYYGDDFTIECPTGSGHQMTLYQVAEEITGRLASIFLRNNEGRRPVYGGTPKVSARPVLARSRRSSTSTSTATTAPGSAPATKPAGPGIIARAMHLFATTPAEQVLELGKLAAFAEVEPARTGQSART